MSVFKTVAAFKNHVHQYTWCFGKMNDYMLMLRWDCTKLKILYMSALYDILCETVSTNYLIG